MLANAAGPAFVLAGGTDLLVRMKLGHIEPELLVDIKRIPAMGSITHSAKGSRIGAAVPGAALGRAQDAGQGLARVGRGGQPDRLRPDPGPLHDGR